ncbi:MAG: alpha/beta hydrolase family protein [Planctomycetota bacterium]
MTECDICLFACTLLIAAAARGAEDPAAAILVEARDLRAARKEGLRVPADGTWHAWAWQRGGKAVTWEIAGAKLGPASADGDADHFAWVKLGGVELPGDQPFPIAFEPSVIGPKRGAVAALLLAANADCDPVRLWQLTRVYPDTARAAPDERPATCHHLNERFTMRDYESKAAWETRAAWLRDHVRVSTGLLPEPERTPLEPQVFDRIERDGYTIEKAYFESRPGFYVCGNLYRPRGQEGPFPGVACPHGHWSQGRFGHEPPRGSVPARCITLARLGCVVFSYDMVGYNDSGKQIGHRIGLSTRRNQLWGIGLMHLQSWNTMRALDFLQGLPGVDGERLAVTGCSGGGTQTFMVMGVDPRVTVAAPVNMISGIMQGGCECENAPLLRIGTCNIEIGALMAPRPLILCSVTGDWTRETPKHEYPKIRNVYELYSAADRVTNVHDDAPHGYNKTHREAVYNFFLTHLLDRTPDQPYAEPPFQVEKKEDLLVWNGRELPKEAKRRKALEAYLIAEARRQRDALLPSKPEHLTRFRETLGVAYRHALLAELPTKAELTTQRLGSAEVGGLRVFRMLLGRKGHGDRVPAVCYAGAGVVERPRVWVVVLPEGKAGLLNAATGEPTPLLGELLRTGQAVLAIDPYLTGEYHSPFAETKQKRDKKYFTTYNRTLLVQRVQDILTALAFAGGPGRSGPPGLVGVGEAGAWCLLAAPFAPVDTRVVADLAQLGGDDDPRWQADLFSPCLLEAGAPWTAVALAAPRPLLLHNLADGLDLQPLRAAYRAAGAADKLRVERAPVRTTAIVRWLQSR